MNVILSWCLFKYWTEILAEVREQSHVKCMLKVNNRNNRKRSEIISKLTIKTSEQSHWRRFGVFIVNFEHISHLFSVFVVDFEKVNVKFSVKFQKKKKITVSSNLIYLLEDQK